MSGQKKSFVDYPKCFTFPSNWVAIYIRSPILLYMNHSELLYIARSGIIIIVNYLHFRYREKSYDYLCHQLTKWNPCMMHLPRDYTFVRLNTVNHVYLLSILHASPNCEACSPQISRVLVRAYSTLSRTINKNLNLLELKKYKYKIRSLDAIL